MSDSIFVEATAVETTVIEETAAAESTALATVQLKPEGEELMRIEQGII